MTADVSLGINNPLHSLALMGDAAKKAYDKAKDASDAATKNAQKNADKEIKAIDKKIEKINEEADARIRAIEDQADKQDYLTDIQKEQINYQQALLAGDMSRAAQSQLNIQGLTNERQKTIAVDAINDKRNAELKKLEEAKAGVQERLAKLQEKSVKLQEEANKKSKEYAEIQSLQQSIAATLGKAAATDDNTQLQALARVLASDVSALSKMGTAGAKAASSISAGVPLQGGTVQIGGSITGAKPDWLQYLKTLVNNDDPTKNSVAEFAGTYFADFGGNVDKFGKYVEQLLGIKTTFNYQGKVDLSKSKGIVTGYGGDGKQIIAKTMKGESVVEDSSFIIGQAAAKDFDIKVGSKIRGKDNKSYRVSRIVKNITGEEVLYVRPDTGYAMGGSVKSYDGGGNVSGPGTATSDSIPAMLSNGEYVIKADSVDKYGKEFFDGLNTQKFAGGGSAKNKSLMQPGDKWDNRSTTQAIGKFLLGNVGPQSGLLNAFPKDIKNKITSAMWSMFGKPFEEIAAGSPTKGDWANAALSMVPMGVAAGAPKAALGLKNIKEAKAWTHYAHQAATEVFPSIGRQSNAMANYGLGTYGSASDIFKGAQFGEEAHKLSLSPLALIRTALGKGPITDAGLAKEAAAFNKATGRKISGSAMYLNDEEFVTFLSKKGYSGYKVDDVITNWKIGSGGVGLKNSLGKLPFGKQPAPISYPELPDMPGILFAKGGYVPKFHDGINNVPADMLAQLQKNEAVIPANMNPFNPNANNATMGGGVYNITNNINGADCYINELSDIVTRKTIESMKTISTLNIKTVGQNRSLGSSLEVRA